MMMRVANTIAVLLLSSLFSFGVASLSGEVEANIDKTREGNRKLQSFDFWLGDNIELCNNNPDMDGPAILGECDRSRFPSCRNGREEICYNRKPSRDHFHSDTHQPKFYIEYDRVLCYPQDFEGCSSCTPGRYCLSERRCILDEVDYPCARWF